MADLTSNEIHNVLSSLFPSPSLQEVVSIEEVRPVLTGWETEVYSFTRVHHRDGVRAEVPLILRLYPGLHPERKMVWECEVLARLRAEGYPVPSLNGGSPDLEPFGKPFLVMERIMGPTLRAAMTRSTPEELRELFTLFCGLFLRLHQMDWRKLTPRPVSWEGDSSVYLREELDKAVVFGEETGINKEAGFRSVLRWLDERAHSVPPAPLAFTHNDYHPENVLLREDGTPSVIDWGSGQVGDYRMDLAWTLLLMGTHGSTEVRADVLEEYERLKGERVAGLEYFEVWASARRLYDIYLTLTRGTGQSGLRPGAEALIRGQMPVVRKVYDFFQARSGLDLPEIERLFDESAV